MWSCFYGTGGTTDVRWKISTSLRTWLLIAIEWKSTIYLYERKLSRKKTLPCVPWVLDKGPSGLKVLIESCNKFKSKISLWLQWRENTLDHMISMILSVFSWFPFVWAYLRSFSGLLCFCFWPSNIKAIMMVETSGSMCKREVERRTPAPKQRRQEVEIIWGGEKKIKFWIRFFNFSSDYIGCGGYYMANSSSLFHDHDYEG